MTPELLALLQEARRRAGSVAALAEILHLSRGRTADLLGGSQYSLNVRGCLRLALSEGLDGVDVLRKAGHGEEAELLQQLLALSKGGSRRRLDRFGMWLLTIAGRTFSARDQKLIRDFVERLAEPPPAPARPPRRAAAKKRRP